MNAMLSPLFVSRAHRSGLAPWQLQRVFAYVDEHLAEPMSAGTLSALVPLSLSQFFRAFKASTGMSPRAFIMQRRIRRACDLMRDSDHTLARIAIDCGFCDQPHLCRLIRRDCGTSPQQWRRAHYRGSAMPERARPVPRARIPPTSSASLTLSK